MQYLCKKKDMDFPELIEEAYKVLDPDTSEGVQFSAETFVLVDKIFRMSALMMLHIMNKDNSVIIFDEFDKKLDTLLSETFIHELSTKG